MDKGKFLSLKVSGFQVTDKMQIGQTDEQARRLAVERSCRLIGLQSHRLADLQTDSQTDLLFDCSTIRNDVAIERRSPQRS